jgi:hypothetical protein
MRTQATETPASQSNVYLIRASAPHEAAHATSIDAPDLCAIARAMASQMRANAAAHAGQRPAFLVLRASNTMSRLQDRCDEIAADWLVVPTIHELLDQLCARPNRWPLVILDAEGEDRHIVAAAIESIRLIGWGGNVLIVDSTAALDRHAALLSAKVDVIVKDSQDYERALVAAMGRHALSGLIATRNGEEIREAYRTWVPRVISSLAQFAGPGAGDVVRREFHQMHARTGCAPQATDVVSRVAERLNVWPNHKARFVAQFRRP